MPTRRWDPGIGDEIRIGAEGQQGKNQELSEGRFSSNLTRFDWVSGIGNFGIFWPNCIRLGNDGMGWEF
ncbi:hypothetical protein YC2023_109186 [Brassica napus]